MDCVLPAPGSRHVDLHVRHAGALISWIGLLAIGLLSISAHSQAADPPPMWNPDGIDDFEFTERSGKVVSKQDLLGRPWLACFVFTRCAGPCPRVTEQMKKLQDQLTDTNIQLVTFGVDPDHDTLEVLRKYADFWRADPDRWWFLTGEKSLLYRFIEKHFRVPVVETEGEDRKPGFEVIHSTNIMYVDDEGRVRAKFNATKDDDMVRLRRVVLGKHPLPPVGATQPPPSDPINEGPVVRIDPTNGTIRFEPGSADREASVTRADSVDDAPNVPGWVTSLPDVNAALNALATLLLIGGLACIKSGRPTAHKACMLTAFGVSIAFLACYLTYHTALRQFTGSGSKRFDVEGVVRLIYLAILLTHVVLAAVVPVLAANTIWRAFRGQWERHRRLARITFPIWLYVSVTGVIIYCMLYHWPKD
jgi:protein SCO1/2/putative membrane protein